MTASYRLIHFEPNPFVQARFPLGAVVRHGPDVLSVAVVDRIPSAECLGDRSLAVAVRMVHDRLHTVDSWRWLPPAFGPYVLFGAPTEIPLGVKEPMAWVHAMLNPTQGRNDTSTGVSRRPRRSAFGDVFFKTVGVDHYVRKTFHPKDNANGWLSHHSAGLEQITHWVPSPGRVLLMEPIVPSRAQFEDDIKKVAKRFLAYRSALEAADGPQQGELIAYITAGGHPDQHAHARHELLPFAHRVVDTPVPEQRALFVNDIVQVGRLGLSELVTDN